MPSRRSGSRTCPASGSSLPTPSRTTSDWWSCIWVFQTGTTPSHKLASTRKPSNGSDSCHQSASPSISRTGDRRRSSPAKRTLGQWLLLCQAQDRAEATSTKRLRWRVSSAKSAAWDLKLRIRMRTRLKNSWLSRLNRQNTQRQQWKSGTPRPALTLWEKLKVGWPLQLQIWAKPLFQRLRSRASDSSIQILDRSWWTVQEAPHQTHSTLIMYQGEHLPLVIRQVAMALTVLPHPNQLTKPLPSELGLC